MNILTDDSAADSTPRGADFLRPVEPTVHASLSALAPGFLTASYFRPALIRPAFLAPFAHGEFPDIDRPVASNLDYDVPFIPVVSVISPIRAGMCALLSRFAGRVSWRERRGPKTEAAKVSAAGPGSLLPGGGPPTAPKP